MPNASVRGRQVRLAAARQRAVAIHRELAGRLLWRGHVRAAAEHFAIAARYREDAERLDRRRTQ